MLEGRDVLISDLRVFSVRILFASTYKKQPFEISTNISAEGPNLTVEDAVTNIQIGHKDCDKVQCDRDKTEETDATTANDDSFQDREVDGVAADAPKSNDLNEHSDHYDPSNQIKCDVDGFKAKDSMMHHHKEPSTKEVQKESNTNINTLASPDNRRGCCIRIEFERSV